MESASIRYKNPGAMWGNTTALKWGAAAKPVVLKDGKGQGNNIAVFPTYVQGICAQLDLWRSSKNYRNQKFSDAIVIWSGHNEVESYISFVLKRVPGMTRSTIMNDAFWQSDKGVAFLKAQAWHEAGKKYPAPDKDWVEAQNRVFEDTPAKNAPMVTATTVIKAARGTAAAAVGIGGTASGINAVVGPVGETVTQVRDVTDNVGQVVATTKEVVTTAPDGFWLKLFHFVQHPAFLTAVIVGVGAAWALTWWLRKQQENN